VELKKSLDFHVFLELTLPKKRISSLKMEAVGGFPTHGFSLLASGRPLFPQNLQVPRSSFLAIQAMHTMVIASGPVFFFQGCHLLIFARKTNEGNGGMEKFKECLGKQSKSNICHLELQSLQAYSFCNSPFLKGVKELLTVRTSKIPFKRCLTLFGSQNQRDVVLRKRIIRVSSFDSRNMGRPLTLIYTS